MAWGSPGRSPTWSGDRPALGRSPGPDSAAGSNACSELPMGQRTAASRHALPRPDAMQGSSFCRTIALRATLEGRPRGKRGHAPSPLGDGDRERGLGVQRDEHARAGRLEQWSDRYLPYPLAVNDRTNWDLAKFALFIAISTLCTRDHAYDKPIVLRVPSTAAQPGHASEANPVGRLGQKVSPKRASPRMETTPRSRGRHPKQPVLHLGGNQPHMGRIRGHSGPRIGPPGPPSPPGPLITPGPPGPPIPPLPPMLATTFARK